MTVVENGSSESDLAANAASARGRDCSVRKLRELMSKLNPMADEFVPRSLLAKYGGGDDGSRQNEDIASSGFGNGSGRRRRKNGFGQGRLRGNRWRSKAGRDDAIRRTVYVSEIDHQVTEEKLAELFVNCGEVVDCRVCGDPNSVLRFAFVEFTDEEGAKAALSLSGAMIGCYPVKVIPSKTAITPINPNLMPQSVVEREMCGRTIYCTNIDREVSQADVKLFFEAICGEVHRLRVLGGDYQNSTRIAFVEFVHADSATAALNCSGVILGSFPIRVSPSKTPVRPGP